MFFICLSTVLSWCSLIHRYMFFSSVHRTSSGLSNTGFCFNTLSLFAYHISFCPLIMLDNVAGYNHLSNSYVSVQAVLLHVAFQIVCSCFFLFPPPPPSYSKNLKTLWIALVDQKPRHLFYVSIQSLLQVPF